ncbi:hypothetical protein LV779_13925 [Streptomyces thinghirensis]|nr:hypothetical protein [Streptomyces thinghirensis]
MISNQRAAVGRTPAAGRRTPQVRAATPLVRGCCAGPGSGKSSDIERKSWSSRWRHSVGRRDPRLLAAQPAREPTARPAAAEELEWLQWAEAYGRPD